MFHHTPFVGDRRASASGSDPGAWRQPRAPAQRSPTGSALLAVLALGTALTSAIPAPGHSRPQAAAGYAAVSVEPDAGGGRGGRRSRRNRPPEFAGSGGAAKGDFNGDGIGDLAVGVPNEDISRSDGTLRVDAGQVNIIYGTDANGLDPEGSEVWHQDSVGVPGTPESFDRFGSALAAGNFNGDDYSDLAIGVPGEDITVADGRSFTNTGAINILAGSPDGLVAPTGDAAFWSMDELSREDHGYLFPEGDDLFGAVMVWADFNADGFGDLAVGLPNDDVLPGSTGTFLRSAGRVVILWGSVEGLRSIDIDLYPSSEDFTEDRASGNSSNIERDDRFGATLAAGDFNGDGAVDLAVGVPFEDLSPGQDTGQVYVMYSDGLRGFPRNREEDSFRRFHQNLDPNRPGATAEPFDRFGLALASGDFNGDGFKDLAVGVPQEDVGTVLDAGLVQVFYGHSRGLSTSDWQEWTQNSPDVAGGAERDDQFGKTLAPGDLNGDGKRELAIGVPLEDLTDSSGTAIVNAGMVHILIGAQAGLTATGSQLWSRSHPASTAPPRTGDQFGASLSIWNFGKGSQSDMVVGVPFADLFGFRNAGAVDVFYGSASGLTTTGYEPWSQGAAQGAGSSEEDDEFGTAVY